MNNAHTQWFILSSWLFAVGAISQLALNLIYPTSLSFLESYGPKVPLPAVAFLAALSVVALATFGVGVGRWIYSNPQD